MIMSSINLTIDEIKQHLNVDHDLDDDLIESYKVAAFEVCQKHIGKTFSDEETENTVPFTPAIKVGCLMYIGHLYTNREITTDTQQTIIPMTIKSLWDVYREPCAY